MKISIVYFSQTGTTKMMSNEIIKGMEKVDGIEVKAFDLNNIDKDYINESKGIIFGTPTYCASLAWQIKQYVDINREHALAGKLGGAFATANYIHGGGDIAINAILSSLLVRGMIIYSGGGALGTPIIHLGPVAIKDKIEEAKSVFEIYGTRFATKVKELFDK